MSPKAAIDADSEEDMDAISKSISRHVVATSKPFGNNKKSKKKSNSSGGLSWRRSRVLVALTCLGGVLYHYFILLK